MSEASQSILTSIKKKLGLDEAYEAFDLDVVSYINSAFFVLRQLGVGPSSGFAIDDKSSKWNEFTEEPVLLNAAKTYVYHKTRLAFDPPGTAHHLAAIKEQIAELENRMVIEKNLARTNPIYQPERAPVAVRGGDLDD